jgi:hypothetical protein
MCVDHFLAMVIYREHSKHTDKGSNREDAYAAYAHASSRVLVSAQK